MDAVAARLLAGLADCTLVLAGADELAYIDVDDTVRQTYGYAKQGAGCGYTGVKGLNALIATVSTPSAAPVIAAARLRKGSTNSAKGAARLVADALVTAKAAGRAGFGCCARTPPSTATTSSPPAAGIRRASPSPPARSRGPQAISTIDAGAWTTIKYPNAIFDEDQQRWISDAEVAEIPYTAFSSRPKDKQVTARLIVRRVPDLNPAHHSELFTVYRYHAVLTDSPLPLLAAEAAHRSHAIIEQVIADLKNGPLAHLPSGRFWANSAWLVCAAIAFNLTRAAGALAPLPRTGNDRDRARASDHRPRTTRPLRQTTDPAPATTLALGTRLATARRRRAARPAATRLTLTHPSAKDTTGDLNVEGRETGRSITPPILPAREQPTRKSILAVEEARQRQHDLCSAITPAA